MKVIAFKRELQGTGASRRLRKSGQTPGIVYGGAAAPVSITLDHNALYHALKKEVFHSSILDLEIDGVVEKVLLRDFQVHAYKQLVLLDLICWKNKYLKTLFAHIWRMDHPLTKCPVFRSCLHNLNVLPLNFSSNFLHIFCQNLDNPVSY